MSERKQGNPGPLARVLLDIERTMSPAERARFWLMVTQAAKSAPGGRISARVSGGGCQDTLHKPKATVSFLYTSTKRVK